MEMSPKMSKKEEIKGRKEGK